MSVGVRRVLCGRARLQKRMNEKARRFEMLNPIKRLLNWLVGSHMFCEWYETGFWCVDCGKTRDTSED